VAGYRLPVPRALIASVALAAVIVAGAASSGCSQPAGASRTRSPASTAGTSAAPDPAPARPGDGATTPAAPGSAPPAGDAAVAQFAVGVRRIDLARGNRDLPTTVWYPAAGAPAHGARPGARVADGRFPVVVYSHGLNGLPEHAQSMTTRLAAAGFVVVAPQYPYTHHGATDYNAGDVPNQPQDASYVITRLLELDGRPGDEFAGHLRGDRVAAAGHSAGGFTTAGLLGAWRDPRLRAGVVIAGGSLGGFRGSPANMLYVHGDKDPTVTYPIGRAAYDRTPWPKALLTMLGRAHGDFLGPGATGFDTMMRTIIDFLRWSLYDESAARQRLTADATAPGVTTYESRL
jgi:dienelactone hydrolase